MYKFDHTLKLPNKWEFVKVYYRQGINAGNREVWPLCFEVGYWDGESWKRLNMYAENSFQGQNLKYVEGWEPLFQ